MCGLLWRRFDFFPTRPRSGRPPNRILRSADDLTLDATPAVAVVFAYREPTKGHSVQKTLTSRLADDLDAAFPELVSSEIDVIYTTLVRAGERVDAEDIVQETFLRAYSALGGYSAPRIRALRLRSWLLTIALNLWRNELRRRARHPVAPGHGLEEEAERADGPEVEVLRREADDDVAVALRSLPEIYRAPVVLRHVIGLPVVEIAEVLDRPTGTVKAQVSRGLAILRASVGDNHLEEAQ
jgi:RNA polymerase sigma factor (sigma-70 family)